MSQVIVEICIESVDDARAAAGADRLELCQALAVGGLTPSSGLQKDVRDAISIPLMTMIRPRPGGFCYGGTEFGVMQRDIELAINLGTDGIVFGCLTHSGEVDVRRTAEIVRQVRAAARPLDIVFHRAFDFVPDPLTGLDQLIELGVTRVLTSGQKPTALEGAALIGELVVRSSGRIQLLAGSGVRPENAVELVRRSCCDQIHAALRKPVIDESIATRGIPLSRLGTGNSDSTYSATDPDLVRSLLAAIRR